METINFWLPGIVGLFVAIAIFFLIFVRRAFWDDTPESVVLEAEKEAQIEAEKKARIEAEKKARIEALNDLPNRLAFDGVRLIYDETTHELMVHQVNNDRIDKLTLRLAGPSDLMVAMEISAKKASVWLWPYGRERLKIHDSIEISLHELQTGTFAFEAHDQRLVLELFAEKEVGDE